MGLSGGGGSGTNGSSIRSGTLASMATSSAVVWTATTNTTAVGSTLTKTGGVNGVWDADGSSTVEITGDGYYEFKFGQSNAHAIAGLNTSGDGTASYTEIDYAIYCDNGGAVTCFENGVSGGSLGSTTSSDVWRIEVVSSIVYYKKNGVTVKTSLQAPVFPLHAETSFFTSNASITNSTIYASPTVPTDSIGANGDLYLVQETWTLFEKVAGVYTSRGALSQSKYAYNEVDITTTLATAGNAGNLRFPIGASERWSFEFVLQTNNSGVSGPPNGGIKYALSVPSGATLRAGLQGTAASSTSLASTILTSTSLSGTAFNTANIQGWMRLTGTVVNSTTPGYVQLQYASGTATETSTIYKESWVRAVKLS
jgi:hypothetical protein